MKQYFDYSLAPIECKCGKYCHEVELERPMQM